MKPVLAGLLLALLSVPALAADDAEAQRTRQMQEAFARMDREEFLEGLEKVADCTGQRNFSCADRTLQEIRELSTQEADQALWLQARTDLMQEKARAEEERREQEEIERERRAEERRAAELEAEQERAERAAEAAYQRKLQQIQLNNIAIATMGRGLSQDKLNQLMQASAEDVMSESGGSHFREAAEQIRSDSSRRYEEKMQRLREERAQRDQQRQQEQQALQQRLSEQRARDNTVKQQAQVQAQAREQAALAQAEQARLLADNQRQQEERQRKLAQDKADREAQKAAEKAQAEQEKKDYLKQLAGSITLKARKCPGPGYYIVGNRPRIKPEVVACVNVRYGTRCAGSQQYNEGLGKNFIGVSTDCFMGDTYEIQPKPSCPVEEVEVKVLGVEGC